MNEVYRAIGMSRQNFHQVLDRMLLHQMEQEQLRIIIRQVREDHPKMACRVLYQLIHPQFMGRDRFEAFCRENGFMIEVKRNFRRTTNSLGVTRFPNLLEGLKELTAVNQVWVSDITYYEMNSRFYYLTFIMDLYSRNAIGYSESESLLTNDTTVPALKMAIRNRQGQDLTGLIFHSDGGGQYYCKDFLSITSKYGIKNSMCESVYENPHAERLNRTIKNNYLYPYGPKNRIELRSMLKKAVDMYNIYKPHDALKGLSPVNYEEQDKLLTENQLINKRKKEAKKEKITNNIFINTIN
jgi:transposase InsO family protein